MAAQRNVQKKKSKRKNTRRQNQDGHPRSEAPFLKEAPISSAVAEALRAEAATPTDHGALEEPEASAPKECLTSDASAQTKAKPEDTRVRGKGTTTPFWRAYEKRTGR